MEIFFGVIGGFIILLCFLYVKLPVEWLPGFLKKWKYKKLLARLEGQAFIYTSNPLEYEFVMHTYKEIWNSRLFNSLIKAIQKKALTIEAVPFFFVGYHFTYHCKSLSKSDSNLLSGIIFKELNGSFWVLLKVENGEFIKMKLEKNIVELMKGKKDKKEILEEITEFIEH
jgi:hypothetical protein